MKVVVGLSGGVDSSVAAWILAEQGHDVSCVFMKNWDDGGDGLCTQADDYEDARSVALKLGLPFYTVDFTAEYRERVFSHFLSEYAAGRTPNPDVLCNSEIKFKAFLDYAERTFDAQAVATGHYARTGGRDGRVLLLKGEDPQKDQSYFLSFLSQRQLAKAVFPLGGMMKSQVRETAARLGLRTAAKKDSTGICFIGERNFRTFLSGYFPDSPGDVVDRDSGKVMGSHQGLMYYTPGQRRGIGIGGAGTGERWYVCGKDTSSNVLYVAQGDSNPLLFSSGFASSDVNYISCGSPEGEVRCHVKHRYRQDDVPVRAFLRPDGFSVVFDEPQRGVAPGQIGVLYSGDECLGAGVIGEVRTMSEEGGWPE